MIIELECERCEELCAGFGETEPQAEKSAAKSLAYHLRWFHGRELLEENEASGTVEKQPLSVPLTLYFDTPAQKIMLDVLEQSWDILKERSAKYKEAWLNRGAIGSVLEILKLSDRIKANIWDSEVKQGDTDVDLDDLYDLLNYTLACISQAEQGHWTHG